MGRLRHTNVSSSTFFCYTAATETRFVSHDADVCVVVTHACARLRRAMPSALFRSFLNLFCLSLGLAAFRHRSCVAGFLFFALCSRPPSMRGPSAADCDLGTACGSDGRGREDNKGEFHVHGLDDSSAAIPQ